MTREDGNSAATGTRTDAGAHLARALSLAWAGRDSEARAALAAAISRDPGDAAVLALAARVHFAIGDVTAAMEHVDRAVAMGFTPALETKLDLCNRLHRCHEAIETAQRAIAEGRRPARTCFLVSNLFERLHDWGPALEMLQRGMAASPPDARYELATAHLLHHLGRDSDAREAVARALDLGPPAAVHHVEAASLLARTGDLALAEHHARRALALDPSDAAAHAVLGQLRLWARDLEGARASAGALLAAEAGSLAGLRLRGAVLVLERSFEGALAVLDPILDKDPRDSEALVFRGEAKLGLGRLDEALVDLDRAVLAADDFLFAARALRLLAGLRAGRWRTAFEWHGVEELRETLAALCPDRSAAFEEGDLPAMAALLERCMERLGGNRTTISARLGEDGRLQGFRAKPGPRLASRRALELIQAESAGTVLAGFDRVIEAHPRSSLPLCHRGELHLWLGDYDRAKADLQAAIGLYERTRWAYVGLTMIEIAQGRFEEALRVCEDGVQKMGSTGTSVYVHRGEAHRKLGRLDEARRDLQRATELHPTRVSAWINLALVHGAASDHAAQAALFEQLRPSAVGLLSDAASALGIRYLDSREAQAPEGRQSILETSLAMMRGNRSSTCITYIAPSGHLRCVPRAPPVDRRDYELRRVRALLKPPARP